MTGNTVIDALRWTLARIQSDPARTARLDTLISQFLSFDWKQDRFVLITGHRRENFGVGIHQICEALVELAKQFCGIQFVYPLHMNPNIREPVGNILKDVNNIHLIEPLDYEPFCYLLQHSYMVLTDSGGIQEEAPSLGKPVWSCGMSLSVPKPLPRGQSNWLGQTKDISSMECLSLLMMRRITKICPSLKTLMVTAMHVIGCPNAAYRQPRNRCYLMKNKLISVIGLGYIGLPATAFVAIVTQ